MKTSYEMKVTLKVERKQLKYWIKKRKSIQKQTIIIRRYLAAKHTASTRIQRTKGTISVKKLWSRIRRLMEGL